MNLHDPVSSIMTSPVTCIEPNQPLVDLKHIYEKVHFHHHVPVTEDGKLVGVVSLIDFMREVHHAGLDDKEEVYQAKFVRDIMTSHPVSTEEETPIEEVAQQLVSGQFNSMIVTKNGKVTGIVTTADLVKLLLKTA